MYVYCRVIIPSTFMGGPWYMHECQHARYAMCYVRKYGHDCFITTMNPNWPEI